MIDPLQITNLSPRPVAFIRLTVACEEMPQVFGPAIGELMAALAVQGIAPAGPVFAHHLRRPTETFDFELGVVVGRPVTAAGRIQPGEWPAMRAARTVYHGPYDGLGDAWGEFMDQVDAAGHRTAADFYEAYLTNPDTSPDPATWQTEFTRPLAD